MALKERRKTSLKVDPIFSLVSKLLGTKFYSTGITGDTLRKIYEIKLGTNIETQHKSVLVCWKDDNGYEHSMSYSAKICKRFFDKGTWIIIED
jgi:hypothetical protein